MTAARSGALVLLFVCASAAHAEMFRCRMSDGSVGFQDRPCPPGASGTAISVSPAAGAAGAAAAAKPSSQDQLRDAERERRDKEVRARDDEAAKFQKAQRCNAARRELGVLNEGRPVFRRDDAGERHYIDDMDRAREAAIARQRVADECS